MTSDYGPKPSGPTRPPRMRLVADNEGHLIEQAAAKPRYKDAEAERARKAARQSAAWADRKTVESAQYNQWTIQALEAGRDKTDIRFDMFVRESGVWSAGNAPIEQSDGTDVGDPR